MASLIMPISFEGFNPKVFIISSPEIGGCQFLILSWSSKVFNLGLITYSNKAKVNILKVPNKIIEKYGAVSEECCLSMVKNLSKISKANISISITGIAGPNGGTKLKPVGLVYIGVKKGNKIIVKKNLFKNKNRISIQKLAVKTSLEIINRII